MTLHALLMKSIGAFGIFRVFYIFGFMALQAALGMNPFLRLGKMAVAATYQGGFVLRGMMVAVETIQAVPFVTCVGLVVKEHFACLGLVHEADRFFGCFDREGGITDDCYQ